MGRRDRRHARGPAVTSWVPFVVVLALLGGAVAAYHWDLGHRLLGTPTLVAMPQEAPPPGLTLPSARPPAPVAEPAPAARPLPGAVRRALADGMRDPHLGKVHVAVAGLSGPPVVADHDKPVTPASTTKLLTTTAALESLGPDHRFATTTVLARGRVTLVGGGDPYLASKPVPATEPGQVPDPAALDDRADLRTLARDTATALRERHVRTVRLAYDDSRFTGPAVNPRWPDDYVPDGVVPPITALWADEGQDAAGYGFVADPAATAAADFRARLAEAGIRVRGTTAHRPAPVGSRELARVTSAPLADVVEHLLAVSDNQAAEVLARQVGIQEGTGGSSRQGVSAVRRVLAGLGIPLAGDRWWDGSGLSRQNRVRPSTLVRVLQTAAAPAHPELRSVVSGLPVAGFLGSLADRYDDRRTARGLVRAKTGTLAGVSSLAGIATDRTGTPIVFALMSTDVPLADGDSVRTALDHLAAALADCRCTRSGRGRG